MKIKELTIYSKDNSALASFYAEALGVRILKQTPQRVSLDFGNTVLHVDQKPNATPYHFAINIPSHAEHDALQWLKERVVILKDGDNEIQDFHFWNAKAMYFYDADQNIVELIARRNLQYASEGEFSAKDFIEISEIGMPTTNIEKRFTELQKITDIAVFDGAFDRFCAMGDEQGLFICIDKNKKDWYPTNDKAFSSEFELTFVNEEKEHSIVFKGDAIRLINPVN
jgi:catechol-2,3-dioxygenase